MLSGPVTVSAGLLESVAFTCRVEVPAVVGVPLTTQLAAKTAALQQKFARLEACVAALPWFDGEKFSLVDGVFGPVFRYFDVFDEIADFGILAGKPNIERWRKVLSNRASVRSAVSADYPALLRDFIASLH